MALVLRNARGVEIRAVELGDVKRVKPLFYRELEVDRLSYCGFRRLVLKALGLKLDARLFSGLLRKCDPGRTGFVTYKNFVEHTKDEELLALRLGLVLEKATGPLSQPTTNEPNVFVVDACTQSGYLHGAGFSRKRLRRELAKARSQQALHPRPKSAPVRPKPRRGLLRHEITELRGAGILLTEGQVFHTVKSVAQDSWIHPSLRSPQLATTR